MPSMVSRDDVYDELVKAGVKVPHVLSRLMSVIDGYARGRDIPEMPDPWSALLPGESDTEEKITRCSKCAEIRGWVSFPLDKRMENGRRTICKSCEDGEHVTPENLFLDCHGACGQRKHASEFYRRRNNRTGYGFRCKECTGKVRADGLYRCRRCKEEKPLEEFPPSKRVNHMLVVPCLACEEKNPYGEADRRRRWKCPSFGKEKADSHFPQEKHDNPRLSIKCIACTN